MCNDLIENTLSISHQMRSRFCNLGRVFILMCVTAVVASCGSGPGTEATVGDDDDSTTTSKGTVTTEDGLRFKQYVWNELSAPDRCGNCHSEGGTGPTKFADPADVLGSFSAAITKVDKTNIAGSELVTKVGGGHNCWQANDADCATDMTAYISTWLNAVTATNGRQIQLTAPVLKDAGASKSFPQNAQDNGASSFENTVYPLLTANCVQCHADNSPNPQSPFFANADVNSAYQAAKSKMKIDYTSNDNPPQLDANSSLLKSRFIVRLKDEFHNCWNNDCAGNAVDMQNAIKAFADAITVQPIDSNLVVSKALSLGDAIIASGGIRFQENIIAFYEFKDEVDGNGVSTLFNDTSGVLPALHLQKSGNVVPVLGNGIEIISGKAQASTQTSKKLYDFIRGTGEYSLEAWVVPGNITQQDARIMGLSGGVATRNFSMSQYEYNYQFLNRSDLSGANGNAPDLVTPDANENLQASQQHVVMTFDSVKGSRIFVDGVQVAPLDGMGNPVATNISTHGTNLSAWDDAFAFVLGDEATSGGLWKGKIRLAAIHNRVLTQAQIQQNYSVGVGQKYFMLFSVAQQLGANFDDSYVMFELELYDNNSYLFNNPTFINLDPDWVPPSNFTINGMRIGINAQEALVGQAFANINVAIDAADWPKPDGQVLSPQGTIIALDKGPDSDEFFLTFEVLGLNTNTITYVETAPSQPPFVQTKDPVSKIGVRTFDEINTTMATMIGVENISNVNTAFEVDLDTAPYQDVKNGVNSITTLGSQQQLNYTFSTYKQALPTIEDASAFLPSHQMAIAQLAMSYCSVLVESDASKYALDSSDTSIFFKNAGTAFDIDQVNAANAFDTPAEKDRVLKPLLSSLLSEKGGTELTTQSSVSDVEAILGASGVTTLDSGVSGSDFDSLISCMTKCTPGVVGAAKCPVRDYVNSVVSSTCTAGDVTSHQGVGRTKEIVKATCAAALGSASMLVQ